MNSKSVRSPLTYKYNVKIIKEIDSSIIVELYSRNLNINVDKYFYDISKVNIIECQDSHYRFYYPPTISGDGSFYEDLQKNRTNDYYSEWRWEHEQAYEEIHEDDHVLDIGCGTGNFLSRISEKTQNIQGLEFNDMAIEKCNEKNIPVIKSDITEFSRNISCKFDVVCAFQVLEHIYEINTFIESCIKVLKKNGKLIIGVPNNNPYLHKQDFFHTLNLPPHHIGLWNKKSLNTLPYFFSLKKNKIIAEPNFFFNYWYDIQLKHYFGTGRVNSLVNKTTRKILKKFNKYIDGRNLFAVYTKI